MRQTLFYLPETIAGLPLFGFGWALGLTILLGAALIWRTSLSVTLGKAIVHWAPTLAVAVFVILMVMPAIERMPTVVGGDELPNHGVPIRGYGMLLFLACASAVTLAARRAASRGIDPDVIYRLAVSFFIGGLLGARIAYFVQYWDRYPIHSFLDFLWSFLNIAEGGLVVYGSLIGAMIAFGLFTWRHRLSPFRLGDVIAPCLLLGLAIGRIGCFLNGCCWGGLSEAPWHVQFPDSSPPYVDQGRQGLLWGFRIEPQAPTWVVQDVLPESPAARAGLKTGDVLDEVGGVRFSQHLSKAAENAQHVEQQLLASGNSLPLRMTDGRVLLLQREHRPVRSLPVHPTQLYSTLGALFLLAIVLAFDRIHPPAGAVMALTFTLYPIARFGLEYLRDDEPGLWGSPLTVAQWCSIFMLLTALTLWAYLAHVRRNSPQTLVIDAPPRSPRSGTFSHSNASKMTR